MGQVDHLPIRDRPEEGLLVVSMMICRRPRVVGKVVVLSACDSVWGAVEELPLPLRQYLTDDLGNATVEYGGFVYVQDARAFDELSKSDLYACIRAVRSNAVTILDAPIAKAVSEFSDPIVRVGWDVVHGNGWVSASCDGIYPMDVFSAEGAPTVDPRINSFGLFDSEEDAKLSCEQNNKDVPAMAPWYPVAVLVDSSSYARLRDVRP